MITPVPTRRYRRAADVVEDTAELAEFGLDGDAIAARLGMSWEGVCRAHRRVGAVLPVAKNADAHRFTPYARRK